AAPRLVNVAGGRGAFCKAGPRRATDSERGGHSRPQPVLALWQRLALLFAVAVADEGHVAPLPWRWPIRRTSHARRVRGVGGRTQGRVECLLRLRDALGVRLVRGQAKLDALPRSGRCLRTELDVQTDAGDIAVRVAAPGLLAAAPSVG